MKRFLYIITFTIAILNYGCTDDKTSNEDITNDLDSYDSVSTYNNNQKKKLLEKYSATDFSKNHNKFSIDFENLLKENEIGLTAGIRDIIKSEKGIEIHLKYTDYDIRVVYLNLKVTNEQYQNISDLISKGSSKRGTFIVKITSFKNGGQIKQEESILDLIELKGNLIDFILNKPLL